MYDSAIESSMTMNFATVTVAIIIARIIDIKLTRFLFLSLLYNIINNYYNLKKFELGTHKFNENFRRLG